MRYGREICLGMRYLHSMNIIHRDLKLENILVLSVSESDTRDGICKISDFGTARETDISNTLSMTESQSKTMSMTMTSNIGTPLYMAPEILSGQSHYSQKADIYSYGIVLCGLWNQQIPYSDMTFSSPSELYSQIVEGHLRPSLKSDCPQPYIQLVSACLQSDPHSRPSFDEISRTVFGVSNWLNDDGGVCALNPFTHPSIHQSSHFFHFLFHLPFPFNVFLKCVKDITWDSWCLRNHIEIYSFHFQSQSQNTHS